MATRLSRADHFGTVGAYSGIARKNYTITPGLYAVGTPGNDAPVIVTANYKLTFDTVRKSLQALHVWLLVIDTRGINVWCAAGKKTFSTAEVSYQVKRAHLERIVSHRTLVLPQLSAIGVNGLQLKKQCGFRGVFGPVMIEDLPTFLHEDMHASEQMRAVTFTLQERLVLIPVELTQTLKPLAAAVVLIGLLSGFGPDVYSLNMAMTRSSSFLFATLAAIVSGAVLTPLFLPWLPVRQFWLKGILCAVVPLIAIALFFSWGSSRAEFLALTAWFFGTSSYLAMNFTGSTPYTSLSGVELEMRKGLPIQLSLAVLFLILWLIAPFLS